MFDVGFSELLIIAVVALLVLGPERLPRAARFAGLWVRRARAQWYSVKSELERELAAEDLKRQFGDPLSQMQPAVQQLGQDLKQEFDALDPKLPARVDLEGKASAAAPAAASATPAVGGGPDTGEAPPVIGGSPWSIPEVAEGADGIPSPTPAASKAPEPSDSAEAAMNAASLPAAPETPDEPTTGDLFGDGTRRP